VLAPETIARYEPEITSQVIALNTQHLPIAERDMYGKAFMDADITVAEPVNDDQRADRRGWLADTPVGSVPDTPLNPVLYRSV
jgi:hypothetical protein